MGSVVCRFAGSVVKLTRVTTHPDESITQRRYVTDRIDPGGDEADGAKNYSVRFLLGRKSAGSGEERRNGSSELHQMV